LLFKKYKGDLYMGAKPGIWMPSAAVVCYECHGPVFPRRGYDPTTGEFFDKRLDDEEFERLTSPSELKENNSLTNCDWCGDTIQIGDSIAAEHNMTRRLIEFGIDASMAQTGGMNSACEIAVDEDRYYLATYNWDGDKKWYLCEYDDEGSAVNYEGFVASDDDVLFQHIIGLDNVRRL
jgi:hypothetical protein